MKFRQLSAASVVALLIAAANPAVLHADTIYYQEPGVTDIKTVSGTIVRETDDIVEIRTADGWTVSIARGDVFQIIHNTPNAQNAQKGAIPDDILKDFPAAAAAAGGESYDEPQSHSASNYHYGFKGGLATSNVRADPQQLEDGGSLLGFALGFWWGVPLSRRLTIQPEILFSMKGDSESSAGYTASTQLSYLEVPVLARFSLLPNAPVQPSLFVGPSLAFNLSAHSKLKGDAGAVEIDVKDKVAGFDYGLVAGGGLGFLVGGKALGVDLRYSQGLGDVGDGVIGSAHNEAVTFMLSIGLQ
jgi:hypothetical protein